MRTALQEAASIRHRSPHDRSARRCTCPPRRSWETTGRHRDRCVRLRHGALARVDGTRRFRARASGSARAAAAAARTPPPHLSPPFVMSKITEGEPPLLPSMPDALRALLRDMWATEVARPSVAGRRRARGHLWSVAQARQRCGRRGALRRRAATPTHRPPTRRRRHVRGEGVGCSSTRTPAERRAAEAFVSAKTFHSALEVGGVGFTFSRASLAHARHSAPDTSSIAPRPRRLDGGRLA